MRSGIFNCAALACDGRLLGIVAKQHLAGDGIHYEPRWFRRWPAEVVGALEIASESVPIGDLLFDCGGVRVGFEICRDAWGADRTGTRLAQRGADILLNPSASHFAFAKQEIRERFVLEGSRAFCVSYAYANLLGNEAGRAIYDGGTLIASNGKMLVSGPRFSYADWVLTTALVDVTATRRARSAFFAEPGDAPRATDDDQLVAIDFTLPLDDGEATTCSVTVPGHPQWETDKNQKEEEFARAVPLALFDYLRKSHARGLCVSLSGGADSSAVAVMVWLMAKLATKELGIEDTANKLNIAPLTAPTSAPSRKGRADACADSSEWERGATPAPPLRDGANVRLLVRRLLTCVYQSTCNSGEVTLNAARSVAEALGAEFVEWDVDRIVSDYAQTVSEAIGRPLTWETDDVALQNIQARARGPGIWLLANLRGALLLTTSNRSEAAVGYATMDGDTCGGLAPIAGIDKAFLLDWLKWMETSGPAGIGPLPALEIVNNQRPTAELRPPAAEQTDEGDLMPYRVLDAIERLAIRDKLMPVEVWEAVCPQFPGHDRRQMGAWVERFFVLWCRNQWKRERYAPSFHLDDENLDPKSWCRFPILNSGYERELAELRERVGQ